MQLKQENLIILLVAFLGSLFALSAMARELGTSKDAYIAEAKSRAANGLLSSDAFENARFDYRNVRLVEASQTEPIVCGEVKERQDSTWAKFHFDFSDDSGETEPFAQVNDETAQSFDRLCRVAVQRVAPGERGALEEIRVCEASAVFAEARYRRARFSVVHTAFCGTE